MNKLLGEQCIEYFLEPLNSTGSAFVVRKVEDLSHIDTEYVVSINDKGYLYCTCIGYKSHGHCKHLYMKPSQFMIDICNEIDEMYNTRSVRKRRDKSTKDH